MRFRIWQESASRVYALGKDGPMAVGPGQVVVVAVVDSFEAASAVVLALTEEHKPSRGKR